MPKVPKIKVSLSAVAIIGYYPAFVAMITVAEQARERGCLHPL